MKYLTFICEQKKMFFAQNLPTILALFTAQVRKQHRKNKNKELLIFSLLTSEKPIASTLL